MQNLDILQYKLGDFVHHVQGCYLIFCSSCPGLLEYFGLFASLTKMVKVFIANIDTSFGHNLANVLSNTFVGSRGGGAAEGGEEEPEEEAQGQAQGQGNEQKEKTKEKEKYVVSGSFLPEAQPLQHPAKAGKMVETGDKKKDAARREAIEKIPTRGVKPKGASECIPVRFYGKY